MAAQPDGLKKVLKDQYLFREGDPPEAMYVIKSGKLAVVKSKSNSEIVLAEIGPGSMVGEMAFFDAKPRSASVKALKDSEMIVLPYKALHHQFQNFPEWCKAIMRTVNDHLRAANKRLKELEKTDGDNELYPPSTLLKLVSILNLVGTKFGKPDEAEKAIVINGYTLRDYTIQVFQEPTFKMQKLLPVLEALGLAKNKDLGEGKSSVYIYDSEALYAFTSWYREWIFTEATEKVSLTELEAGILRGICHFAAKATPDAKGVLRVSLKTIQNESIKELNSLIRPEDANALIEKKILGEPTSGSDGDTLVPVDLPTCQNLVKFWSLIHAVSKIKR